MNDSISNRFNGLVLAGGRSSRMGQDKAQLTLPGRITLLEHARQQLLSAGAGEVYLNHSSVSGAQKLVEPFPDRGPLSGIHAALCNNSHLPLLILPVDMPLMTPVYLRQLVQYGQQKQHSCYFHEQCLPLFVFQSDQAKQLISAWLSADESPSIWRLLQALQAVPQNIEDANACKNANDPEQWRECLKSLGAN